jgi:hypothetical protein
MYQEVASELSVNVVIELKSIVFRASFLGDISALSFIARIPTFVWLE